jgi:outer membrane protein OmpA-like peptidoglycan-associated protein/tetratricopeptide (TPR) repeat protein
MKQIPLIFIIAFSYFFSSVKAQQLSSKSDKALKLYELAMNQMQMKDYNATIKILNDAIKTDSSFTEAWLLMADAADMVGNYQLSAKACNGAIKFGGAQYKIVYLFAAQANCRIGNYTTAIDMAEKYIETKSYSKNQLIEANKVIENAKFAIEAIKHPVKFNPVTLGDSVNTRYDEYWPCITGDDSTLFFTRRIPRTKEHERFRDTVQEDIFVSNLKKYGWGNVRGISFTINTENNEGAQTITADGQQMFFTACDRADGYGRCDIYYCKKEGNSWSSPKNLGNTVNSSYSETQPSVSSDGRTLFFASNRPGGKGKQDIWVTTLDSVYQWTKPVNLGDSINTSDMEESPFIHADNTTLYFSSKGWPGLGASDIFISRKKENGWATPKNIGYPINTYNNEVGLIVNASGNKAYYTSDRDSGMRKNIYAFELTEKAIKPQKTLYFKGRIYDALTGKPLGADFELTDLSSKATVNKNKSNAFSGEFLVCLPGGKDYGLNVNKTGYLFYSENFTLSDTLNTKMPVVKNIPLQPIQKGKGVVLKNIFFATASYELNEKSNVELMQLVKFLKQYNTLKIEVRGHTDDVGEAKDNLLLSQNRAKAVADFLTSHGIDISRVRYKGYGETIPVDSNKTPEGRAQNRRTEFVIIE